ncbi:MAG: hypothetical protein JWO62_2350 [Acidimicrobiaceae bacterium]|nr:hypothetical protein [Acidimicrobiaceae bacterium]
MFDVLRAPFRTSLAEQQKADIEAIRAGATRLVRCYVEPAAGEHRAHWKPGHLQVRAGQLIWKGSSHRWKPVVLSSGDWSVTRRNVTRTEQVYRSFVILECVRGLDRHVLAVPRHDVDLCIQGLVGVR